MLGFRATGYYENYIIQMHALTDISETHGGQDFSFKVGRYWQYKNWNLHAIQAVRYNSAAIANYYFSVQPEDASEKFPEFHAHAGFNYVFELGATYPLSQKWVFRSSFRHVELEHQWAGSPLLVATHADTFINSISYVF
jgi:outer membrane protein